MVKIKDLKDSQLDEQIQKYEKLLGQLHKEKERRLKQTAVKKTKVEQLAAKAEAASAKAAPPLELEKKESEPSKPPEPQKPQELQEQSDGQNQEAQANSEDDLYSLSFDEEEISEMEEQVKEEKKDVLETPGASVTQLLVLSKEQREALKKGVDTTKKEDKPAKKASK